MVHSFTVYLLNKQGATGATLKNLTETKMNNITDTLAKANSFLKTPVSGWVATILTQVPTYCSHALTSQEFSIWIGRRTGAVYVVVYSEQKIYKSVK